MQLTNTLFGLVAAATVVYAQVGAPIRVTVGADGVLQYNPNNIVAEVGTEVEFDFFPKNHTVTQSSFANPCHPLANGFFSGFIPTTDSPSGTTFTIKVNDTKPIWFYCGQTIGNHCQAGMVGAINAPTTGNTFAAFAALAKNATASTSPPGGAVGGLLQVGSNSNSTSSTASLSSSAYTTKPYTSTYTSDSHVYTVTATTTLFTAAPASTTASSGSGRGTSTSSSTGAAFTGAASGLKAFNAVPIILAAAAILY